ncbi:Zinc transporter ZupT [uncultured delta proteobacterium]|uniref:Zinc transporter ZupT n=1 Tax=uncultured delta proteobacterium TaxID=34034 RepID=A0A212JLS5_9DELT|nr:Zinc transporter ZupT [uncultured delta proteobacterium]
MDDTILLAFGLTAFAGLSTGIGALFAFCTKRANTRFLSAALGFSAGVMLYVSFVEILVKARDALTAHWGHPAGAWAAVGSFFAGVAVIAVIDKLVPAEANPHEIHNIAALAPCPVEPDGRDAGQGGSASPPPGMASDGPAADRDPAKLHRMGLFTALAIAIHNFPEGLATFTATLTDPSLGFAIAIAIAIHNIPEGIAVAVPIYFATGDRKKAFFHAFLSGLAEPVGALVGFLILLPFFSPAVFGMLFGSVAGIMVFISLDELLPTAEEYGEHHLCIYGAIAGMALMAVSLLLFM